MSKDISKKKKTSEDILKKKKSSEKKSKKNGKIVQTYLKFDESGLTLTTKRKFSKKRTFERWKKSWLVENIHDDRKEELLEKRAKLTGYLEAGALTKENMKDLKDILVETEVDYSAQSKID
eukprot:g4803.t1